jgi:hypothetical protein
MRALGIIIAVLGIGQLVTLNMMHIRRYGRFVRYLESHHPAHWKSVGSPVQFEDEPQYGSFGYADYFASRRYAELGDPHLSTLGDKTRGMRKWMFVGVLIFGIGTSIANGDIKWF